MGDIGWTGLDEREVVENMIEEPRLGDQLADEVGV